MLSLGECWSDQLGMEVLDTSSVLSTSNGLDEDG